MDQLWNIDRPEIESRAFKPVGPYVQLQCALPPYTACQTSLDLLEINASSLQPLYKRSLDHNSFLDHVQSSAGTEPEVTKPTLRMLFLHSLVVTRSPQAPETQLGNVQVALHHDTAQWLINHLGVSPIFINSITTDPWLLKSGNACFKKWNKEGKVCAIDGLYRYSCGIRGLPAQVWFSHDLIHKTSFYIARNCSEETRQHLLRCAFSPSPEIFLRPLVVDTFIAEGSAHAWGQEIIDPRNRLINYEHMDITQSQLEANQAVGDLHTLSQHLHILKDDLTDLTEMFQYILDIHQTYVSNLPDYHPPSSSSADSLAYLLSRTMIWKRWVQNYAERTGIRINLFFNLATQKDNRTNLDIAHSTSKIATETQKDSSSMITMAAVTMLFLPGTFVSAIFSMVFFNTTIDNNGNSSFSVSPTWWYFPTITIPLTAIVFLVWNIWRWRRSKTQLAELEADPEQQWEKADSSAVPVDWIARWAGKRKASSATYHHAEYDDPKPVGNA